jgi:SAM-dependent methyltransferase
VRPLPPLRRVDPAERGALRRLGERLLRWLDEASGPTAANLLAGRVTAVAEAAGALPMALLEGLRERGLARVAHGRVRFPFQIVRVGADVVVTDRPAAAWRRHPSALDPLWAGAALRRLMLRGSVSDSLDLGCGSGVLALAAAEHSRRVMALDVNPRAVACTELNAALNGRDNVEVGESDLFASAGGERFARILFNSPTGLELRPRGWLEAGETVLERFFRSLLDHLEAEGVAQVSLFFMERHGDAFWPRLRGWLGAERAPIRLVFFEQFRRRGGWSFFRDRLLASIRDRANGFAVRSVSRGWLVLQRGEPFAVRIPLPYKRLAAQLPEDFGDRVVRHLLARQGHLGTGDPSGLTADLPQPAVAGLRAAEPISWDGRDAAIRERRV